MDIANAGMGKVKDMLKKVAIGETIIWKILGIIGIVLFFAFDQTSHAIWILGGIAVLIGIISGVTLYFGTVRNENLIYKLWFVETVALLVVLVLGVIFAGMALGKNSSSVGVWFVMICSIVLIPVKIYFLILVAKFYKWNNRAGVVNAVASAFS